MAEIEYIVETTSGTLYHLILHAGLLGRKPEFGIKQLTGRTSDFNKDLFNVYAFVTNDRTENPDDPKKLRHGVMLSFITSKNPRGHAVITQTTPVVKIFKLVDKA